MGQIKGDKARYNRQRRKKIAKRVDTRALRGTVKSEGAAPAKATTKANA